MPPENITKLNHWDNASRKHESHLSEHCVSPQLSWTFPHENKISISITEPLRAVASPTADPGIASSIPAQSHTFVETDHELISTDILSSSADSRLKVKYG